MSSPCAPSPADGRAVGRPSTAVWRGSRYSTTWPPPSRIGGRWNARDTLATPYQRYDFLELWQRHVGPACGMTPFIVVGLRRRREPLFLWPFGVAPIGGLRVAEFLGGKHANFNMALWRRDVAAKIGADDLRAALDRLAGRADIVKLINQPLTWGGTTNPFALLPHQRSANLRLQRRAGARLRGAVARAHQCRHPQEDAQEGTHARQLWRAAFRARQRRRTTCAACSMPSSSRSARACARSASRMCSRRPACGASSRRRRPNTSPAASRRSSSTRFRSTTSSSPPWAALSAADASAPCSIRSRKGASPSKARASN